MTKKLIILVTLLFVSIPNIVSSSNYVFEQVDTAWVRRYNGPGNSSDQANAIAVDDSGNVYVTGRSSGSETGYDYATVKYYPNGDTAWVRRYNGPGNGYDYGDAIAVDDSGNVYLTGSSYATETYTDYATIKYYPNGDTAWVRRCNGPGNGWDYAYAIALDDSGSVYVTGTSGTIKYDTSGNQLWLGLWGGMNIALDDYGNVYVTGGSPDYVTIKYYTDGDTAWVRIYDGPANSWDWADAIAVDDSGNVYVTGQSSGSGTGYDYATIKYYPNGDTAWVRRYNGPANGFDVAFGIAVDGSRNVHVTGYSAEITSSPFNYDYATIKYYPNGDTAWVRRYSEAQDSIGYAIAIAIDDSNNAYVTGGSWSSGTTYDYATIKYYPNGDTAWVRRYNGPGNNWDEAYAIAVDGSANVYVTGFSYGSGTGMDYATIKYVPTACATVGKITICADSIVNLGGGNFQAEGDVWVGNQTGDKRYLYLGAGAEVTFNINQGIVSSVVYADVKLSALGIDYAIDNIASLLIDAQAGRVSFGGRVHYASEAIFQSSFSGACTLEVNLHELYGRIQFDNSYFGSGTVGIHRGIWNLDGCPFMGISGDINLTTPVIFTDLTLVHGEITIGVFLNTGIFRVGLTNGAMEFRESGGAFGFNLTGLITPPGFPSQGMIDIDLAHLRVNVIKDIPIGLWKFTKEDSAKIFSAKLNLKILRTDWRSLKKLDQNTYGVYVYDEEGNKYQKLLVNVGLTIKGEEPYTDLDCDGYHDPSEPFEDKDGDGVWDEGTNIALLNQSQQPVFDAHGHATLNLRLALYVNFTCVDAVLDIEYPNNNIIKLQIWSGLKLGNIFTLDLAAGILFLDFQNQEYSADATFNHPSFPGLTFTGHLLIAFTPLEFEVGINQDFKILGVDVYGSGAFLRVDQERLYIETGLNAFTLLNANGKLIFKENAVDGFFTSDFHIDGWHLSQTQNEFHFQPSQCMSVSAPVKLCPFPLICVGGMVTFRICSLSDWGVVVNGTYIGLGCPADLHVYDSQGRHTGLNQSGGIDLEIPGSEFYFSQDSSMQLIFIPGSALSDVYTIDVKGESTGVIDLDVLYPNQLDSKVYDFTFFDEPTQQGALHRVILDSTDTWTMRHDLNGDSIFESQSEPDSSAEAILDTTMVTITNVSSEILCANEAKITWNTNVPATSEVLYRSEHDSIYKSVFDTTLTTSHSVLVDNILTNGTYYYIVVSIDTSGNIASFLEKSFKLDYVVGDVNRDGVINSADIVYLINYLFAGGPAPQPLQGGDANCDGKVNSADIVYLINYLFAGGPPPNC